MQATSPLSALLAVVLRDRAACNACEPACPGGDAPSFEAFRPWLPNVVLVGVSARGVREKLSGSLFRRRGRRARE